MHCGGALRQNEKNCATIQTLNCSCCSLLLSLCLIILSCLPTCFACLCPAFLLFASTRLCYFFEFSWIFPPPVDSPVSFVQLFLLANRFSFCMLTLHILYLSRHSITVQKHFIDVCLYDNCNFISLFLLNNFTHTNCVSCALFGVLWLWWLAGLGAVSSHPVFCCTVSLSKEAIAWFPH